MNPDINAAIFDNSESRCFFNKDLIQTTGATATMSIDPPTLVPHPLASVEKIEIVLDALSESLAWTDASGKLEWCNVAFADLLKQNRKTLLGNHLAELLPLYQQGQSLSHEKHPITLALGASRAGFDLYEFRQSSNARILQISWAQFVMPDQAPGAVLTIRDATHETVQRSLAPANLKRTAKPLTNRSIEPQMTEKVDACGMQDALTGLSSRMLFLDRLEHTIQLGKRHQDYGSAVLLLDIDRFKVINDSLGRQVGDQLLKAIAQRLADLLKTGDTVARVGEDEFGILLDDIPSSSTATQIAEQIKRDLGLPFNLKGREVFITASIGIIPNIIGYNQAEELLRDAEIAMYQAKESGRGHYEVFNSAMQARALAVLQLETDLRQAIDNQEFLLHYQPIFSLRNQEIIGLEALIRWQHPTRGLVSPGDFIPVAEETGLIVPIGYWALRQACQQLRFWQQQFILNPSLFIAVNISGRQFAQPDLVEQVRRILRETELNAKHLKLELTESTVMEDVESATTMLSKLHNLGIQLSIDDFGTGYSSLAYLSRFPIDTLKIDKSFVNNVDTDPEKMEIIRTIVMLAWNLGMDVVAEGVETTKQQVQLKALQCESGQGYFFSKPLNSEAITEFLNQHI